MDKHVFVINGSGGVGKDTVCVAAARFWKAENISSITPILDVAYAAGWDGRKTPEARRFLSRLKEVCTEFNDLPFSYCMERYHRFLQGDGGNRPIPVGCWGKLLHNSGAAPCLGAGARRFGKPFG